MTDTRRDSPPDASDAELDSFDIAILRLMQDNNQLTSLEIGARVGLSASAVQRRLRRLRKIGVIMADVSIISPEVSGNHVTVIVEVSLEREQLDKRREFEKSIRSLPEVTQCYYVTGRADFVLVLKVSSMDAYNEFTSTVFVSNPNVKQFYTAVVMSTTKFTMGGAIDNPRNRL